MPPMPTMDMGRDLSGVIPELILAALVLILLPVGAFLPAARQWPATALALVGLSAAGAVSVWMLTWPARTVFLDTYVIDPFAVYFKLLAIAATGLVLLATVSWFRDVPFGSSVPAVLVLTCLGIIGLAASQDLALIALFIQLVTVGSYILVGVVKADRRATEGALKLFLYSAAAGAVMLYGMSLLFGLTGTLRLPELAARLPAAPLLAVGTGLALLLVGYGFKITLVPFHSWAPDTYEGAPTAIAGYMAVGPKAAGLAVLVRTLVVAFPRDLLGWPEVLAVLAALTMTLGNVFALRQSNAKRLLAYSSIGQAGYLLVGVAAAGRDPLAVPGLLVYLAVYLFMNLGAWLAVDALERGSGSVHIADLAGQGRQSPLAAAVLTLCLLSLAGFPPLGGFVGKTMLLGAALGAHWDWLAIVLVANTALSLYYYVRLIEPLYLRPAQQPAPRAVPGGLRASLLILGAATLVSGVLPDPLVALARYAAHLLLPTNVH